jgi:hypothetical protein
MTIRRDRAAMRPEAASPGQPALYIGPTPRRYTSVQRAADHSPAGQPDGIGDRPDVDPLGDLVRHLANRSAPADGVPGRGVALVTTPAGAAAIAAGEHQIRTVDGRPLRYPSQQLTAIESSRPDLPGQTHTLARHVGRTLADDVARVRASHLRAAGSYATVAAAQTAVDRTIANPANQAAIGAFLADRGRVRLALSRVDLGGAVGGAVLRRDVAAGRPRLIPETTATVVLIKDPSFPEGYRVLTTFPDLGRAEVDARGRSLS